MAKILMIMTIAATSGSMLFNFSTSSNYELLANKFIEISQDPAQIGIFLSGVYVLASFTQLLIGYLIVVIFQRYTLHLRNLSCHKSNGLCP